MGWTLDVAARVIDTDGVGVGGAVRLTGGRFAAVDFDRMVEASDYKGVYLQRFVYPAEGCL